MAVLILLRPESRRRELFLTCRLYSVKRTAVLPTATLELTSGILSGDSFSSDAELAEAKVENMQKY